MVAPTRLQLSGEYLTWNYLVDVDASLVIDVDSYLHVLCATAPCEVQDKTLITCDTFHGTHLLDRYKIGFLVKL